MTSEQIAAAAAPIACGSMPPPGTTSAGRWSSLPALR